MNGRAISSSLERLAWYFTFIFLSVESLFRNTGDTLFDVKCAFSMIRL